MAILIVINVSCTLFSAEQAIPFNHDVQYHPDDEFFRSKYDGFCAGILVKTPSGYNPIETLHVGDYLLDPHDQPKRIEGIAFRWVPRYWRVRINSEDIGFGVHQSFYTPSSDWRTIAESKDISTANGSIKPLYDAELIEESTCLYMLTVEDHIFCITTYDLMVHNAEALVVGAVGIALENFAIAPAVISAVQTTLSLSFISYRALQEYCAQQDAQNKEFNELELCQKTRQAERRYFETRKQELEKLRDEFLIVKDGLQSIGAGCNGGINFTLLFLRQQTFLQAANPGNLLLTNEMQLSQEQYEKVRTARDMYLNMVEQEIDDLHLIIALHLNEVIENVKQAEHYHWQVTKITTKAIDAWNRMCYGTIPADVALQLYEHCLYDYYSLQKAKQYLQELTLLINFYRREFYRSYLSQTIPLQELLDRIPSLIKQHEEWIAKENQRITSNIAITEDFYTRNNVNVAHIWPQFKAAFEKQYTEKIKTQFFDLQKRQETLKPKYKEAKKSHSNKNEDPKNPRNNDQYENMYEVFARAPIGKKLKDAVESTSRNYRGIKIFRIIRDIKEWGIQKGDWLYLDKLHKDHIEVFCPTGEPLRTILNMDGTQNLAKINQAGFRSIKGCI